MFFENDATFTETGLILHSRGFAEDVWSSFVGNSMLSFGALPLSKIYWNKFAGVLLISSVLLMNILDSAKFCVLRNFCLLHMYEPLTTSLSNDKMQNCRILEKSFLTLYRRHSESNKLFTIHFVDNFYLNKVKIIKI